MRDTNDGIRAERRSVLITLQLDKLDIDIAAIIEVRFPDKGSLKEHKVGYTLYWSGKAQTETCLSGEEHHSL